MNALLRLWIENSSILEFRCPCAPVGTFSVFGLPYYSPAWDVMRADRDADESIVAVIDPENMAKVLIREPTCGWLLSAPCLEPAYGTNLGLLAHLERLARARPTAVPALERLVMQALDAEHLLTAA